MIAPRRVERCSRHSVSTEVVVTVVLVLLAIATVLVEAPQDDERDRKRKPGDLHVDTTGLHTSGNFLKPPPSATTKKHRSSGSWSGSMEVLPQTPLALSPIWMESPSSGGGTPSGLTPTGRTPRGATRNPSLPPPSPSPFTTASREENQPLGHDMVPSSTYAVDPARVEEKRKILEELFTIRKPDGGSMPASELFLKKFKAMFSALQRRHQAHHAHDPTAAAAAQAPPPSSSRLPVLIFPKITNSKAVMAEQEREGKEVTRKLVASGSEGVVYVVNLHEDPDFGPMIQELKEQAAQRGVHKYGALKENIYYPAKNKDEDPYYFIHREMSVVFGIGNLANPISFLSRSLLHSSYELVDSEAAGTAETSGKGKAPQAQPEESPAPPIRWASLSVFEAGGTLQNFLFSAMSRGKFDVITLDFIKQVAASMVLALARLHSYGLVHGDLKPANILLDLNGRCWMTDFGSSAFMDKAIGAARFGRGTVYYKAHECVFGGAIGKNGKHEGITYPASDLYSLGVILFRLVSISLTRPEFTLNTDGQSKLEWEGKVAAKFAKDEVLKDLISRLLLRNHKLRLGGDGRGAEEVMAHSFFDGLNWSEFADRKPILGYRDPENTGGKLKKYRLNPDFDPDTQPKEERFLVQSPGELGWSPSESIPSRYPFTAPIHSYILLPAGEIEVEWAESKKF